MTGEELARARKVLGLTQEELAEAFGTSRDSILRWENGSPKYPQMTALAMRALEDKMSKQATIDTVEEHFENWVDGIPARHIGRRDYHKVGFWGWTWDMREETLGALKTGDYDYLVKEVIYTLKQDEERRELEGLEGAAREYLTTFAQDLIEFYGEEYVDEEE